MYLNYLNDIKIIYIYFIFIGLKTLNKLIVGNFCVLAWFKRRTLNTDISGYVQ